MMDPVFQSHNVDGYLRSVAELSESQYIERISREHHVIINTPITGSCTDYRRKSRILRNRCLDLKCWESSRVRLAESRTDSDFIHANYVSGFDSHKGFVLTQEPQGDTLEAYWSLIWQKDTQIVVMLNCDDESDVSDNSSSLVNFSTTIIKININDFYVETIMYLMNRKVGKWREIRHFKFLNWPKGSVTDLSALINFLAVVNKKHRDLRKVASVNSQPPPGPVVVYSSSGTGRAAAFCAIDICLHKLVNSETISVPSVVLGIRRQRYSSLESLDLYFSVNNAVVFFLATVSTDSELYAEFRSHPETR